MCVGHTAVHYTFIFEDVRRFWISGDASQFCNVTAPISINEDVRQGLFWRTGIVDKDEPVAHFAMTDFGKSIMRLIFRLGEDYCLVPNNDPIAKPLLLRSHRKATEQQANTDRYSVHRFPRHTPPPSRTCA